jgi:hypothetical protein
LYIGPDVEKTDRFMKKYEKVCNDPSRRRLSNLVMDACFSRQAEQEVLDRAKHDFEFMGRMVSSPGFAVFTERSSSGKTLQIIWYEAFRMKQQFATGKEKNNG